MGMEENIQPRVFEEDVPPPNSESKSMQELKTQKDFQTVFKSLSFCYLCGKPFQSKKDMTRDHVPPSSVFKVADKSPALILPAHKECNREQSIYDEEIGQLIGLLHGKPVDLGKSRLKIGTGNFPDKTQAGVVPINMKPIIFRWVRGFHAAIYQEFLPAGTKKAIHLPMPSLKLDGDKVSPLKDILPQQYKMVEVIKKNRAVDRLDRIECRNSECVYECVWDQADNGAWLCIFALQIYNWKDLGDPVHFIQRGCSGSYMSQYPINATKGVSIEIPILNFDKLDPFGN
jgi:hypothetical protein